MKIFLILSLLTIYMVDLFGQSNPAQKIGENYQFKAGGGDSAWRLPKRKSNDPNYRDSGMIWYNPIDKKLHWSTTGLDDTTAVPQNWQQTLQNGNFKVILARDTSAGADTLGYQSYLWQPSNYNTVYPGYGKAKGFVQGWQVFNGVNLPITRPNVVGIAFGYNTSMGGGILDTTELAGAGFRYETSYNLNFAGHLTHEIHWPEFYPNHGYSPAIRLNSYYVDCLTGACITQKQIQSENWDTKNTNTPYHTFDAATSNNDSSTNASEAWALGDSSFQNVFTRTIFYKDFKWAGLTEQVDRGSVSWSIGPGASWNAKRFDFGGNVGITDAGTGVTFCYLHTSNDQPCVYTNQINSSTLNNAPGFAFDRRQNGSITLPNGSNGGEITWQSGTLAIRGIANGTYSAGPCWDAYFQAFNTDGSFNTNLIIGRNKNVEVPSGSLAVGPSQPDGSAMIDAQSTTKGVLDPRMTTTQKLAIVSPAVGLRVFDVTVNEPSIWNGSLWVNQPLALGGSFSQAVTAQTTFTVTMGPTLPSAVYQVTVTPTDALTAVPLYVTNKTQTTFDVVVLSALTGTVSFDWHLTQ